MDERTGSLKSIEDQLTFSTPGKWPVSMMKGQGMFLWDSQGNRYVDFYSGHSVCSLGHCHPRLVEALTAQAQQLFFISTLAYHPTRAKAAERLIEFSRFPGKVFFSNSGAEANENAFKLGRFLSQKNKVIAFNKSFHGRTMGAAALTECLQSSQPPYAMTDVQLIPFGSTSALREAIDEQVGAVIVEPIQSVSGVYCATKDYYTELRAHCDRVGALLIFDEVQTGMGRCGEAFYFHHLGMTPDIVTTAKGLGSGFPIGATLVHARHLGKVPAGFMGSTFGGNPLACAVAAEVLNVMVEDNIPSRVKTIGAYFRSALEKLPQVEVRGEGLLLGLETRVPAKELQLKLLEAGYLVGTSTQSHTLRILPPLIVETEHVDLFVAALKRILEHP